MSKRHTHTAKCIKPWRDLTTAEAERGRMDMGYMKQIGRETFSMHGRDYPFVCTALWCPVASWS